MPPPPPPPLAETRQWPGWLLLQRGVEGELLDRLGLPHGQRLCIHSERLRLRLLWLWLLLGGLMALCGEDLERLP